MSLIGKDPHPASTLSSYLFFDGCACFYAVIKAMASLCFAKRWDA